MKDEEQSIKIKMVSNS